MNAGPEQFLERLGPIADRLPVDRHYDMTDDGGSDSFVLEDQSNLRVIAGAVLEDRPNGRAHLLALDVGGVTGDEKRGNADQRGDDGFVWDFAPALVCAHGRKLRK